MDQRLLVLLTERLTECGEPLYTKLICPPSREQMAALREGDGNPEAEMRQINSSAGLAVTFWRAYELSHLSSTVEFERKMQVPLEHSRLANIDVVVREKGSVTFIESKFLEPYYSENETPRNAYFDTSRYFPITENFPQLCVELFKKASEFKYYNTTQLCRHLLAIVNEMYEHPESYGQKNVRLWSLIWEMPDDFTDIFIDEIQSVFAARKEAIREEAHRCDILLNEFISYHFPSLNLKFEAVRYNDIIEQIEKSPFYSKIKERYYL